jgi:CRISPR/Cas system CMR-associated protein Cmr1 (group 7 of RAMP superfamily)
MIIPPDTVLPEGKDIFLHCILCFEPKEKLSNDKLPLKNIGIKINQRHYFRLMRPASLQCIIDHLVKRLKLIVGVQKKICCVIMRTCEVIECKDCHNHNSSNLFQDRFDSIHDAHIYCKHFDKPLKVSVWNIDA